MTAPSLQNFIQGQGVVTGDQLNTFESTCDNVTQLRAFIGAQGKQVYIRGYSTPGDGGAGPFYWNSTSTGPDNGTTTIVPQQGVSGAWVRLAAAQSSVVIVANIAALRALSGGASISVVWVEGYYSAADGGEGMFSYAPTDNTSADNGGTIIIDAQSHRYYRETSGQIATTKWFGAKCDGTTNDTASIQAALNASKDLIIPPGTSIVAGLTVTSPISITMQSGSTLQMLAASTADMLTVTAGPFFLTGTGTWNCNNVANVRPMTINLITGVTIIGITVENSSEEGIRTMDCSDITIQNCQVYACNYESIALYNQTVSTKNYNISNNLIDRSATTQDATGSHHCIAVFNVSTNGSFVTQNGVISGNITISKLSPSGQGVNITTFANTNTGQPFFNWTVSNNTSYGAYFGLSVGQGYGFAITGNTIEAAAVYSLEMPQTQDSTCTGNTIFGASISTYGIVLDALQAGGYSQNNVVTGNVIRNVLTCGILASVYAGGTVINSNNIEVTGSSSGILLSGGSGHTIVGNQINGGGVSTGTAIAGQGATSCNVQANTLTGWGAGTLLSGFNASTTLMGNGSPFATSSWTPGAIPAGGSVGTVLSTAGSLAGDIALPAYSPTLPAGLSVSASANANDTAVQILNNSSGSLTPTPGTVTVTIFRP